VLPQRSFLPADSTTSRFPAAGNESGLPLGTALTVGGLGLLLSLGLTLWSRSLSDPTQQIDHQLRLSLVITLGFYVLLGGALGAFCLQRRVGLTWTRGSAFGALGWGLPLGAAGGGLAVLLNSAIAGHLASDPRAELLVGGGGALRIGLTFVVTAALAPVVEEVLFRGVLAGTLLARGPAPAVWVSAVAFSIWHMNPTSLRYYVFMGLLLATLWRKRGLLASMAGHAAFNGVLTIAAVAATSGAGHVLSYESISLRLPGGWHEQRTSIVPGGVSVEGPGGAGLVVLARPGAAPTLEQRYGSLVAAESGNPLRAVRPGSERRVQVPAGEAIEADITLSGQPGHVLDLVVNGTAYELLVVTGGSPAAERGWLLIAASVATR
jgi:membrane protease YdiL (CAAX protease family)